MTSSRRPRPSPSSAAILRTTSTSLPMNSPVRSTNAPTEPPAATKPATLLAPLPCVIASSSFDLVHAEAIAQRDGLAQQADLGGEQRVVRQLHRLAGTERADVQDRVAVGGQHRPDPGDGIVGSAHEQRHLTRGDVVRPSADRRVDDADGGRSRGDALRGHRASRRVDDDDRSGVHGAQQVAVEAHLLHLLVGEHADDDHVCAAAYLGQFGDGLRAQMRSPPHTSRRSGRGCGHRGRIRRDGRPSDRPCGPSLRIRRDSSTSRLFAHALIAGVPWIPARCRPR